MNQSSAQEAIDIIVESLASSKGDSTLGIATALKVLSRIRDEPSDSEALVVALDRVMKAEKKYERMATRILELVDSPALHPQIGQLIRKTLKEVEETE